MDGWRDILFATAYISIQAAKWRTDTVDISVPAGKGLEYKLTMKKGATLLYNISYGTLTEPGTDDQRVPRPHEPGRRRRRPDVRFQDRRLAQSGVFTAPWDGIHGWYLKNDSPNDVVVKVELAGFYNLEVM